ncbi:hypothetical protein B0H13DRAFT_2347381 [Mycena leptocephala]|nr:hypothetical protein B0H13DRAFT_2347381 [Mycena leptocephala]
MSTQRLAFPDNLSRPQRVGRGQREGVITPGLQNHLEKRQNDIQKATKAAETRRKNGMTTGRKVAAAADQNRPPQTPLSAVPTRIRSQLETTSPDLPRQPLLSMTSQPSSPFSFNQVQSAAPARSLPSMVPQDYQPVYPDFSQRGNADCSGSEQSRNDEFARMLLSTPVDTSGSRQDPQHYANLNLDSRTFTDNYQSGTADGFGLLGAMMVSTAVILPQTTIPRPGILLNPMTVQMMMKADSTRMLTIEMHDVDVRKKHQKRKRVPQADHGFSRFKWITQKSSGTSHDALNIMVYR